MTSKFLHGSCVKYKEENAQKAEVSPLFIFSWSITARSKLPSRRHVISSGNLDHFNIYYRNSNRCPSAVIVITFIGAIETKKLSLTLILPIVLAPYIE